jgi:hypothetical protein
MRTAWATKKLMIIRATAIEGVTRARVDRGGSGGRAAAPMLVAVRVFGAVTCARTTHTGAAGSRVCAATAGRQSVIGVRYPPGL